MLPLPVTVAVALAPKLIVLPDTVRTSPSAALIVAPEPVIVSVEDADSVSVLPEASEIVLPVPSDRRRGPRKERDDVA